MDRVSTGHFLVSQILDPEHENFLHFYYVNISYDFAQVSVFSRIRRTLTDFFFLISW